MSDDDPRAVDSAAVTGGADAAALSDLPPSPGLGQGEARGDGVAVSAAAPTSAKYPTSHLSTQCEVPAPGPPALVAGPPVHLDKKRGKHEEMIARLDGRIEAKATSILNDYLAAAEIDDPTDERPFIPKPAGWSERKFRIARDGRKPLKQQPGYLAAAQRVKESFTRARGEKVDAPQLNVEVQVHVRQEFRYPVIDVTEREK